MRDTSSSSVTNRQLIEAALISGAITLLPQWYADIKANRKIVRVKAHGSFFNVGLGWEIANRFLLGLTFPAQHILATACFNALDPAYQTTFYKTAIGAFSGTAVALVETRFLHPLDTIKILAQTKPEVFGKSSARYFWQHYWGSLSAGMGVYMLRSTMTNPLSWGARAWTNAVLEEKQMNPYFISAVSSFIFSLIRVVVAYPFSTIVTTMQYRQKSYPSYAAEMKDAIAVAREVGLSALYMEFRSKGRMNIFTSFLRMMVFSAWINFSNEKTKNNSRVGFFREWKNAVSKNKHEVEFNDPWNGL